MRVRWPRPCSIPEGAYTRTQKCSVTDAKEVGVKNAAEGNVLSPSYPRLHHHPGR